MAEIGRRAAPVATWTPDGFDPVEVRLRPVTALDEIAFEEMSERHGSLDSRKRYEALVDAVVSLELVVSWSLQQTPCTPENVRGMLLDYVDLYAVVLRALYQKKRQSILTGSSAGLDSSSSTPASHAVSE